MFSSPVRVAATLLIPAFASAVFLSRGGGRTLDIGLFDLHCFAPLASGLGLASAAFFVLAAPPRGIRQRLSSGLSLALLVAGLASIVMDGWSIGPLSVGEPLRPIGLAVVALLGALPPGEPGRRSSSREGLLALAAALVVAAGLAVSLERIDASVLEGVVESSWPDAAPEAGRDVVLIVVDTLRADALGAYGGSSGTPFLDGLAEASVVFERNVSQAPWTVPSMASLMTGLYPSTLSASGAEWKQDEHLYLFPDEIPRLVTRFADAGHHTAGFVKNGFLRETSDFARGFDVYRSIAGDTAERRSGDQLVNAVARWSHVYAGLREKRGRRPFFLYVHFMDPHIAYRPPKAYVPERARRYEGPLDGRAKSLHALLASGGQPDTEDVDFLRALYAGEVAYLDGVLARLGAVLEADGLWNDDTLVVFVSDHGEQFGERGRFEHADLDWTNVHVPLFIRAREIPPRRVDVPTRNLDLAPTLLELSGLPPLAAAEGRSLVPAMRGDAMAPLPVITERALGEPADFRLTWQGHTLVERAEESRLHAVGEGGIDAPLSASEDPAALLEALEAMMARHRTRERPRFDPSRRAAAPIEPALRRELEALGYLRASDGD